MISFLIHNYKVNYFVLNDNLSKKVYLISMYIQNFPTTFRHHTNLMKLTYI